MIANGFLFTIGVALALLVIAVLTTVLAALIINVIAHWRVYAIIGSYILIVGTLFIIVQQQEAERTAKRAKISPVGDLDPWAEFTPAPPDRVTSPFVPAKAGIQSGRSNSRSK